MGMSADKINGISLHSKYNPQREARRYVESQNIVNSPGVFVLIEPAEGYLSEQLLNMYSKALVLELHCVPGFYRNAIPSRLYSWDPGGTVPLKTFLSQHISEYDTGIIKIIEWPPSKAAFGSLYEGILHTVFSYLQDKRAGIHTTGKFGHRWLHNVFRRVLSLSSCSSPAREHRPILIAASGPSLTAVLPFLKKIRSEVSVWALPSSMLHLSRQGIIPDLVIHTDPGYYAGYHIRPSVLSSVPVASPLTAAVPVSGTPPLLLNTKTPIEQFFIRTLDIPSADAISHGTVAGTALHLALSLGTNAVFFAGLDLEFNDIVGHCRPHTFDSLFCSRADRLSPLTHIYYSRSPRAELRSDGDIQSGKNFSLQRYSEWFAELSAEVRGRVYRVFPSHSKIPAFIDILSGPDFSDTVHDFYQLSHSAYSSESSSESSGACTSIDLRSRKRSLSAYITAIKEQHIRLCQKDTDIAEMPLLEEFISFTCFSELFRLNQSSWNHGSRLKNADTKKLCSCILRAIDQLQILIRTAGAE